MEVENSPTLEELANGKHENGVKESDASSKMPSPDVLLAGAAEDQRLTKKARRLVRTGSREGHPHLVIPGQATAFIAPTRR